MLVPNSLNHDSQATDNALYIYTAYSPKGGRVRLLKPDELPVDWDRAPDPRLTAWEMVHHLVRVLAGGGKSAAADLAVRLGAKALSYNGLVQNWPEIVRLAGKQTGHSQPSMQSELFDDGVDRAD